MNFLFCNLKIEHAKSRGNPHSVHLPYGLGIIMDIFDRREIDYFYYDTYLNNTDILFKLVDEKKIDIIFFSSIVGNYAYPYLRDIFLKLRMINNHLLIILGGPITSIYPETCLQELHPDIIVIGEGEITTNELIDINFQRDKLSQINGLGYFDKQGEIVLTPPREPFPSPLEQHSSNPSFSHKEAYKTLTAYVDVQKKYNRGYDLSASRGCFGNCTFCKRVFDKPVRYFSAEYIIEEMIQAHQKWGITRFSFLDENFIANRNNFKKYLSLLKERKLNFEWRIRSRVDCIPASLVDEMKDLGMYSLMIGLESASQEVLENFKKGLIISKYKDLLKDLASEDLLYVALILGSEVESHDSIAENIQFLNAINLSRKYLSISYLSVIPGTQIFIDLVNSGQIPSISDYLYSYNGDFNQIEMNISRLSNQELEDAQHLIINKMKR